MVGANLVWHPLEPAPRLAFRDDLGCGDLDWERGKAWAFEHVTGTVWYDSHSNPSMGGGQAIMERIQQDES